MNLWIRSHHKGKLLNICWSCPAALLEPLTPRFIENYIIFSPGLCPCFPVLCRVNLHTIRPMETPSVFLQVHLLSSFPCTVSCLVDCRPIFASLNVPSPHPQGLDDPAALSSLGNEDQSVKAVDPMHFSAMQKARVAAELAAKREELGEFKQEVARYLVICTLCHKRRFCMAFLRAMIAASRYYPWRLFVSVRELHI